MHWLDSKIADQKNPSILMMEKVIMRRYSHVFGKRERERERERMLVS